MAVFTIAGLTLKEALRKRSLVGSLLLGLLVVAVSLILILIRIQFKINLAEGKWTVDRFATEYVTATSVVCGLCLFFIRILGMLFAVLMAGGSISGEIETGLLSVIVPKPIQRWQILLGKWIGINVVLAGSVFLWTVMTYLSLKLQTRADLEEMLKVAPLLVLYPILVATVTLTFSTVFQRVLGTSLALAIGILSWADGVFFFLGEHFNVNSLVKVAHFCGLLMPQGYVALRIKDNTQDLFSANEFMDRTPAHSSALIREWGERHLHFANLDVIYIAVYLLVVLLVGAILFHRREIA